MAKTKGDAGSAKKGAKSQQKPKAPASTKAGRARKEKDSAAVKAVLKAEAVRDADANDKSAVADRWKKPAADKSADPPRVFKQMFGSKAVAAAAAKVDEKSATTEKSSTDNKKAKPDNLVAVDDKPDRSNGKGTKGGRAKGDASPAAEVERAEKIAEAMDYRVQGFTFRQIADAMGIAASTAYSYVSEGLRAIKQESAEELLKTFEVQCQTIMQQLMPMMVDGAPTDVIQNILKIQNQWMRLRGIGAPGIAVDVEAEAGDDGEVKFLARIRAEAPVLRPDGPVPLSPVL